MPVKEYDERIGLATFGPCETNGRPSPCPALRRRAALGFPRRRFGPAGGFDSEDGRSLGAVASCRGTGGVNRCEDRSADRATRCACDRAPQAEGRKEPARVDASSQRQMGDVSIELQGVARNRQARARASRREDRQPMRKRVDRRKPFWRAFTKGGSTIAADAPASWSWAGRLTCKPTFR